ncbi:hypothetical protein VTK56DRAFT_3719 [Thermocarpiscus australiensis]
MTEKRLCIQKQGKGSERIQVVPRTAQCPCQLMSGNLGDTGLHKPANFDTSCLPTPLLPVVPPPVDREGALDF